MPCGQPCKEVLDHARALMQSLGCMMNSILLNVANGGDGPPTELRREVMREMEVLAVLAQKVADATPAGGQRAE